MIVSKSVFWSWSRSEPSFYVWSRSRYFLTGAGAEKKYLEPEPWKNGSAPQHCNYQVLR